MCLHVYICMNMYIHVYMNMIGEMFGLKQNYQLTGSPHKVRCIFNKIGRLILLKLPIIAYAVGAH